MNGAPKPAETQRQNSSPWVSMVALGMVCVTLVTIVWLIWGGC